MTPCIKAPGDDPAEREHGANRQIDAAIENDQQHPNRQQAIDRDVIGHRQKIGQTVK